MGLVWNVGEARRLDRESLGYLSALSQASIAFNIHLQ